MTGGRRQPGLPAGPDVSNWPEALPRAVNAYEVGRAFKRHPRTDVPDRTNRSRSSKASTKDRLEADHAQAARRVVTRGPPGAASPTRRQLACGGLGLAKDALRLERRPQGRPGLALAAERQRHSPGEVSVEFCFELATGAGGGGGSCSVAASRQINPFLEESHVAAAVDAAGRRRYPRRCWLSRRREPRKLPMPGPAPLRPTPASACARCRAEQTPPPLTARPPARTCPGSAPPR